MPYTDRETSIHDGEPFEGYEFVSPVGTFRFTSSPVAQAIDGKLFTPLPSISRSDVEISSLIDSQKTMNIYIPIDHALAKAYQARVLPEFMTITVYRAHYGDDTSIEFTVEWLGETTSYSSEGARFVFRTRSTLQAKIVGSASIIYFQLACNHRVYDERCQAVKANFTFTTSIVTVDNINIGVVDQNYADNELILGTMINLRTGEERSIFANAANLISITYPFLDVLAGDPVDLILGCDNKMQTCIDRFDNVINFLGFRYVPLTNIFAESS